MIDDPLDEPTAPQGDGGLSLDQRLGRRIRSRRLQSGVTISAAAQGFGGGHERIEAIEGGSGRPTALELARLAALLQVEIGYFFDCLTDEPNPTPMADPANIVRFPTKAS